MHCKNRIFASTWQVVCKYAILNAYFFIYSTDIQYNTETRVQKASDFRRRKGERIGFFYYVLCVILSSEEVNNLRLIVRITNVMSLE